MLQIPSTNIAKELVSLREKDAVEQSLQFLLAQHRITALPQVQLQQRTADTNSVNRFDFDVLDSDRIFHLRHIRTLCIDYRLRFLDLRLFKPELPKEAILAIQELESKHGTCLEQLKIMAPSRLFKLEDRDDPLLFVPLGNDYYYLVHQWGNNLHPLRRLLVWPFKSLPNLIAVLMVISYVLTSWIPNGLFSKQESIAEFWILYFFVFKMIASIALFYGFALGKNFNPAIWDSKYFNA